MMNYEQALELILALELPRLKERVPLAQSLGRVLATPVCTPVDLPRFDHSAVDGYALSSLELSSFDQCAQIKAGIAQESELQLGQCARIFTGAPIPRGCVAVVMQEQVEKQGNRIEIKKALSLGQNIRYAGEEFKAGECMLSTPKCIDPAALGLLASLGLSNVEVLQKPKLSLWTTGDEVVAPGLPLAPGQIYDANGPALAAALSELGLDVSHRVHLPDTMDAVLGALSAQRDIPLIVSVGGVSVGDFDHIRQAVLSSGFREVFWKLSIKPGKPLFVAKSDKQIFIGLPGNPVAALVMVQIFLRPWLRRWAGFASQALALGSLAHGHKHSPGRLEWCRAQLDSKGELHAHRAQGSHMLSALSDADALMCLAADEQEFLAGIELPYQKIQWRI